MSPISAFFCPFFTAIHSKNLVSIIYLLVALAMHFLAPIRLPEHVSVQVVVVKVRKPTYTVLADQVLLLWLLWLPCEVY